MIKYSPEDERRKRKRGTLTRSWGTYARLAWGALMDIAVENGQEKVRFKEIKLKQRTHVRTLGGRKKKSRGLKKD